MSAWFLNPVCFYLSPVALFFACFYSLTKRFTDYTHVFLGIALALRDILTAKGAKVVMTRTDMSNVALADRPGTYEVYAIIDGLPCDGQGESKRSERRRSCTPVGKGVSAPQCSGCTSQASTN